MTDLWTVIPLLVSLFHVLTLVRGQSTTDSYFERDPYLDNQYNHQYKPPVNNYQYPRSKYYYFFTPRSQVKELLEPLSSEQHEQVLEDRGYETCMCCQSLLC